MKIVLPTSPTFAPGTAGAGTLNFTTNGLTGSTFDIRRLFAVINQTKNALIYAETVSGSGYTAWNSTSKVLTLELNTSTHSSGDSLQAIYDDPNASVSISTLPSLPTGANTIGNVGVTGSVEIVNDVGNAIPISASALPLPAGAATNTVLTDGTQKTQVTSLPSRPTGANTIGNVGVTGALPAGSNSIGTVILGAGTAAVGTIGVSALPAIPAGTNSIGTVILGAGSAAVGNVGVSSLPSIPTGSNTIGSVNVLGGNATAVKTDSSGVTQPVSLASILNVAPTVLTVSGAYSGTTITIPTDTSSLATLVVEAAGLWSGTLIIESTLDNSNWFSVSMVDLRAGTPTTTFPSRPADNIVAVACSVAGFSKVRIRSSSFSFAGSGTISYGFSEKVVSSSSSGSTGGSVTVSNFPATQAVSGSVSVSGNVEITNDAGNAIPVSGIIQQQVNAGSGYRGGLGSGSLVGLGMFITYAYGWEISVENNDTGYGLEPIYIKVFQNRTSGSSLIGVATPDYIITVCDGVTLRSSGVFPLPLQWGNGITTFPFFFATRNKADNDVTPVTSSITFTLYNRSTNY